MNKRLFYWSSVDEGIPSILDNSRSLLWKVGIWMIVLVALFGTGNCPID